MEEIETCRSTLGSIHFSSFLGRILSRRGKAIIFVFQKDHFANQIDLLERCADGWRKARLVVRRPKRKQFQLPRQDRKRA